MKAGSPPSGPSAARSAFLALGALLAAGCAGSAATPQTGESIFINNCAPCHGAAGTGTSYAHVPSIAGLPEWYLKNQLEGFRAGYRGQHYDDVQGMRMRPMALTLSGSEDVAKVAAYVATLSREPAAVTLEGGDSAKGQGYFAVCTSCHGADGKGNETLGAPPLVGATDWYLLTQLGNFKKGVRGAKPGDTRGATMRPMAATLPDEQAMKDVLAYVATLPR